MPRAMLEQAEAFRVMAECSPVLMWVTDQQGELIYVNQAYLEFFGVARDDIAALDWRDLVHADDFDSYVKGFARALQSRTAFHAYARVKRQNGEWRWIRSDGAPFFSPSGEFVGMVGSSPDVTDRMDAEKALSESEARFKLLAEAMPQLVWIATDDGIVTYYNSRAQHYAGIKSGDEGIRWEPVVHADQVAETTATWRSAVASGGPYQFEHLLRMADGSHRWHLSRADRVGEGDTARWFGTSTDVDEIKQAQQALQQLDRSKSEFIAMLAHELRNPLAAAKTATELLARSDRLDEGAKYAVDVLQRQISQMSRLMEDLLDANRIAARKIDLRPERFDLAALAREVMDTWRAAGRLASHRVVLHASATPVQADRARMQQVISNLLDNSLKFSPEGARVAIEVRPHAGRAVLTVADSGRGFDAKEAERLFELFSQGRHEDRAAGGLGLGLAIVKRLVEAQGGSVRAFSEGAGRGAVFTMELPRDANDAPAVEPGSDSAPARQAV